jgi:hypothetical protein
MRADGSRGRDSEQMFLSVRVVSRMHAFRVVREETSIGWNVNISLREQQLLLFFAAAQNDYSIHWNLSLFSSS